MSRIDQFESTFRAAAKTIYRHQTVPLNKALVLTDLSAEEAENYAGRIREFLGSLSVFNTMQWRVIDGASATTVGELLELVETEQPDLICVYRNLHSGAWRWPYTLGDHVEVLTQVTHVPVLLLPRPGSLGEALNADRVMAITDHLSGDDRLVNYAVAFTETDGTLYLSHVEDEGTFDRFIGVIAKSPELDTDVARVEIKKLLMGEATDYIGTCQTVLAKAGIPCTVEPVVTVGHHLSVYRRLIKEHEVDLLVLNTKDDDQLAMHGLAYPLAVELRDVPILML